MTTVEMDFFEGCPYPTTIESGSWAGRLPNLRGAARLGSIRAATAASFELLSGGNVWSAAAGL